MNELYATFTDLPLFAYFGASVLLLLAGVVVGTKTFRAVVGFFAEMVYLFVWIVTFALGLSALGFGFYQSYLRFFA